MKEIQKKDTELLKLLGPRTPRQGVRYIPSIYAVQVPYKGTDYVFNVLTRQCIEAALPAQAYAGEGYDELIEDRFLVPEDKDECSDYEGVFAMLQAFTRKKGYRSYTILPTFGCNARCTYCYEQNMHPVTMTDEVVEQTIRFISSTHAEKRVEIGWFGGEPLLCPDIIDRICEGLQAQEIEYSSSMITNASLITPDIVRKMQDFWNLKRIQISMDGAEPDYISRKCYYDYHDYYHTVIQNAKLIAKAGIRVAIRGNVDLDNWDRVALWLEDLKTEIDDKERIAVYFCPLNQVRQSDKDLDIWSRIVEAGSMLKEAGFRTGPAFGTGPKFRKHHCMADLNSVVISPDGSLYPCEHCPPHARFGDIWNNVTDEAARKAFCRTDMTREKCRACPYLPECTPFAACPVQDTHCRDVMALNIADYVKKLADRDDAHHTDVREHPDEPVVC